MRRLSRLSSSGLVVVALSGSLVASQGCSDSATSATFSEGADAGGQTSATEPPNAAAISPVDAGPMTDLYQGSPLCRVTPSTCDPDDDGTRRTRRSNVECAVAAVDGGPEGSGKGCRISSTDPAAPECGSAKEEAGDGAACNDGSDCAPGFDCVTGESSTEGVCRRYCCTGTCGAHLSKNGGATFCDVQQLWDRPSRAPVCLPIKACKLFAQGECTEDETCAVVTEEGATGCVITGYVAVGESCDAAHCQAGLTCLGQPGSRKCYQLCRTKEAPGCEDDEVCTTSTIFGDPTVGVCAPR